MADQRPRSRAAVDRAPRTWLIGTIVLALVVGCGGSGESVDASATATARFTEGMEGLQGGIQRGMPATVTMTDGSRFDPPEVTVSAGSTVLWRNASVEQHTVTADPARAKTATSIQLPSGATPFESGGLAQGQTFAQQLTAVGEYRYVCRIHEESGMRGIVKVE